MFKILLGEKEISINDRFTLILGKFKKDLLNHIHQVNILEILEDFSLIPINYFINIFKNHSKEYNDIEKSLKLLDLLSEYRTTIKSNILFIDRFSNIVQSMTLVLKYNLLLKNKNLLLKELELSKIKKTSNELAAIMDLLDKLNESINKNKRKVKYLEEDFFHLKNQRDQLEKNIQNCNLQIQDLNIQKKECFNQINKITREMEGSQNNKNNGLGLDDRHILSKSDRIREFQKQAKDSQFKINQIKKNLSKANLKFDKFKPNFEIYEKDYQSLVNLVKNDEKRIKTLQVELIEKSDNKRKDFLKELTLKKSYVNRPTKEIEDEIQQLNNILKDIMDSNIFIDNEKPSNLSKIKKKITEIDKMLTAEKKNLIISHEQRENIESIEHFRKLEVLIKNLELLLNGFLLTINLESHFQIIISEDNKKFLIHLQFIRSSNKVVRFDELTTPEKIFFIITFDISIKILLNSKNIVFSNLFIPKKYDKRSIFRTIRKIIPVFEKEKNLKNRTLIFIISNLELKKQIKNLKIINT